MWEPESCDFNESLSPRLCVYDSGLGLETWQVLSPKPKLKKFNLDSGLTISHQYQSRSLSIETLKLYCNNAHEIWNRELQVLGTWCFLFYENNWRKTFIQLQRLQSEEGFQNDYLPGYYHQFDEDDFNFQPETITIMPTTRE